MKTFQTWLEEIESFKKNLYVLVGPPSVGKSTWIKNTFTNQPYIINRDSIVDAVASSLGLTYDDMFIAPPQDANLGEIHPHYGEIIPSPNIPFQPLSYSKILQGNKIINDALKEKLSQAVNQNNDIVVDMTNMTAKTRKTALSAVAGHENEYNKIAVVFPFQGAEDIIKKLAAKRANEIKAQGGSKNIPDAAIDKMFAKFQDVSPDEGFDQIVQQDNRQLLKQLAN